MGISIKHCADNPEWAARRIDELEAQIVGKFFTSVYPRAKGPWDHASQEQIDRALAFSDALDYSYGYTQWVDSMKALAVALRTRPEELRRDTERMDWLQTTTVTKDGVGCVDNNFWLSDPLVAADGDLRKAIDAVVASQRAPQDERS